MRDSYFQIVDGISEKSKNFFGSKKKVKEFLDLVSTCGSVAFASNKQSFSALEVEKTIKCDDRLKELVNNSLNLALEMAEGVLYERAVNGYTEETIVEGVKVGEKKKYSDSCLLSYLKANSSKYSVTRTIVSSKASDINQNCEIEIPDF